MILVHDVSKFYGSTAVLDGVSLALPKGGLTAIIGPNGAGKSTLLAVLSRLLLPDQGEVLVDGLDVARCPGPALARKLSILRQDNSIHARLTVQELVMFGRFPHSRGRPGADDDEVTNGHAPILVWGAVPARVSDYDAVKGVAACCVELRWLPRSARR